MAQIDLIKTPNSISFSRNPLLFRFKVTPYDAQDIALNTRVVVILIGESSHYGGDFGELKQVSLRPDADGVCEIDWSTLIDAQLEFYVPKPKQLTPQVCKNQGMRYYVRYYITNDYETIVAPANTEQFHAIKGGLPHRNMDIAGYFAYQTSLSGNKTFLRYTYDNEVIHANEPMWLYMLNPRNVSGAAKLHLTYDKAPNQGVFLQADVNVSLTAFKYQVICFPAGIGPAQHNLSDYDRILQCDWSVVYEDQIIPETIASCPPLKISQLNFYNPKYLHYFNSVGGFDTVALHGNYELSGDYKKQDVTLVNVPTFSVNGQVVPVDRMTSSTERMNCKGETGFIAKEKVDRLRDLLNSNLAFEFTPDKRMLPVMIKPRSVALYQNRDQLFSLGLDWQEAWADRNYMPEQFLPAPEDVCPPVEYLQVTQVNGKKARIHWQLAEGYDLVEIQLWEQTLASPPNNLSTTFFLTGNKGATDIDLSFFAFPGPSFSRALRFWARTVCDNTVTPNTTGAWTAYVDATIHLYAPPIVRNDYAFTFKGAATRTLIFVGGSNVMNTDTATNGGTLQAALVSGVGTAGGAAVMNAQGEVDYTPLSGTYTGIDTFSYTLAEEVTPGVFGPQVTGKFHVIVETNVGSTIQNTGNVYVKMVLTNYSTFQAQEANPNPPFTPYTSELTTARLELHFYKDPGGTIVYDVTSLGLTADINIVMNLNGTVTSLASYAPYHPATSTTYPDSNPMAPGTFPLSGTSTNLGTVLIKYHKYLAGDIREFMYSLAASSNYFII